MHIPRTLLLAAALLAAWSGVSKPSCAASDPYTPGLRWSEGASVALPWIPRRIAFTASGQGIWAGRAVGNPGASLYMGSDADSLSKALDVPMANALGLVEVATGPTLAHLYSAVQYAGTHSGRQTKVSRYSAFAEGDALVWQRSLSPEVLGGTLVESAGGSLYCARFDPSGATVWLDRLDPEDGHSLFAVSVAATGLGGLVVSEDGQRIAMALGDRVLVCNGEGETLAAFDLAGSTEALSLSADGNTLVAGGLGKLHVWRDGQSGFGIWKVITPGSPWLTTRAALSADGNTLGAGLWDSSTGESIRFMMWDLAGEVELHDVLQSGVSGGLQNFAEAVAISPDGQRMVCGAWGSGGPDPQLMLLDRSTPGPIFSTYLPGSVRDLALDQSASRIAVGMKAGHANQFSTTGFVQLFDTGERDVQLVGSVETGAPFVVTSRLTGSLASVFVFGVVQDSPQAYAGFEGLLCINPTLPYCLFSAPADSEGRADLLSAVPNDAAFIGVSLSVQAVFAGSSNWRFSDSVQTLTVLKD